jgi:hypothetical protein
VNRELFIFGEVVKALSMRMETNGWAKAYPVLRKGEKAVARGEFLKIIMMRLSTLLILLLPLQCISQSTKTPVQFSEFIGGFEDIRGQLDSISIVNDLRSKRKLPQTYVPSLFIEQYLCRDENLCQFNEWGNLNYHYEFLLFENDIIIITSYWEIQYNTCFKRFLLILSKSRKSVLHRLVLNVRCMNGNEYEMESAIENNSVTTYVIEPNSRIKEWMCDFRYETIVSTIDLVTGDVATKKEEWRCCQIENSGKVDQIGIVELQRATCN